MKLWKPIVGGGVAVLAALQLIPVDRSNPPVITDLAAPPAVAEILRQSCYDCHSNETRWPWYSYVAPVSWLVAHDVHEGREVLNFSDWGRHAADAHMIEEIAEEIDEGEMPLPIYLITHPKASLSSEQRAVIQKWAGYTAHTRHGERDEDGADD